MGKTFFYSGKPLTLTHHAKDVMKKRKISIDDVIDVLKTHDLKFNLSRKREIYINSELEIGVITTYSSDAFVVITTIALDKTKIKYYENQQLKEMKNELRM